MPIRLSCNRKDIDTLGKCETCKHYQPLIKIEYNMLTEFARGTCIRTDTYKQRLETCKKYEKVGD
jgi:hypothetical protein